MISEHNSIEKPAKLNEYFFVPAFSIIAIIILWEC